MARHGASSVHIADIGLFSTPYGYIPALKIEVAYVYNGQKKNEGWLTMHSFANKSIPKSKLQTWLSETILYSTLDIHKAVKEISDYHKKRQLFTIKNRLGFTITPSPETLRVYLLECFDKVVPIEDVNPYCKVIYQPLCGKKEGGVDAPSFNLVEKYALDGMQSFLETCKENYDYVQSRLILASPGNSHWTAVDELPFNNMDVDEDAFAL